MVYSLRIFFTFLLFSTISISESEAVLEDVSRSTVPITLYPALVTTIEDTVRSSNLLSKDLIEGRLSSINCTYYNATIKGLEGCSVTGLQLDTEKLVLNFKLECPHLDFNAKHELKGKIGEYTIEGQGPIRVLCDDYVLIFESHYEKNIGKDNKKYLQIKSYVLDATPRGRVKLDFQNVNAGDKDKTAAFYQFVEENWQFVDKELRTPVLRALMDLLIAKLNDSLRNVAVEQ